MASHRNPLIVVGGGGISARRVDLYVSDDVRAYATDAIALFPSGATRARENMREKTRSMGAARHSGAGRCVPECGASEEDFSRLVETSRESTALYRLRS